MTFDCVPDVDRLSNIKLNPLEHFAIKWKPVDRNKMRQNKVIERGFDSIKTPSALDIGAWFAPYADIEPASRPIALIFGATASGKSDLALTLARMCGGRAEIINADAIQVYAELQILSNRPWPAQMQNIPHHLFGHVALKAPYSVGKFCEDALASIHAVRERGNWPILVGGTGLYFLSLTRGLAAIPPVPATIRDDIAREIRLEGTRRAHERLHDIDPVAATRIHPHDEIRILRALSVFAAHARTLSDFQSDTEPLLAPADWAGLVSQIERSALYHRIALRFDAMLAQGAEDEVKRLIENGLTPEHGAYHALGLSALADKMAGRCDLAEAKAQAIQATRRYAKRQSTFARHQFADWPSVLGPG